MKIAITGGAGFIGSRIAQDYLDAGHDVLIIDNLVHGSAHALDSRARFFHLDIRDSQLHSLLTRERPDVVSHHAAYRETRLPQEQSLVDADINVRGLLNLLEGCVAASVGKFIFASGGNDLYGQPALEDLPVTESTPLFPKMPYNISKVAGEWYVRYYTRQYGLNHTILRYADVYGERHHQSLQHPLSFYIKALVDHQRPTIRGSADSLRDHIYIDDVVQANRSVLERGKNQTLHISSGQGYSVNGIYNILTEHLGIDLRPVYVSGSLEGPTAIFLDNSKAGALLDWQPQVSLSEGIQRAVRDLCNEQMLVPGLLAVGGPVAAAIK